MQNKGLICGLKITHDSGISIIENGKLIIHLELEKLQNNNRFAILDSLDTIPDILAENGIDIKEVDTFVVDGWIGPEKHGLIKTRNQGDPICLKVAPYHEIELEESIFSQFKFPMLKIGNNTYNYESYTHVAGHIFSAYCTSPFSFREEEAYILIWDGGMYPRLYHFDPKNQKIKNLGPLFYFGVNAYSIFSQHFGPFRKNSNVIKDELSVAGKVMAYVAYGSFKEEILQLMETTYQTLLTIAKNNDKIPEFPYIFALKFKELIANRNFLDEDIIATFHHFLEQKLLGALKSIFAEKEKPNLCFAGGAALNIKWNSSLRASNLFREVWIPPFPNDSGSALGSACCAMIKQGISLSLDWSIYSGPQLIKNAPTNGWTSSSCTLAELARILAEKDEPVIYFDDRAAIGPRALGHRSIIASPVSIDMKNKLNFVKYREPYRPVAPVCLEEKATLVFDPGCPDPYMLFEHRVRPDWVTRVPAIMHKDGSARLQTINQENDQQFHQLLTHFYEITGIPLLCNTSANFKGSGFFPDIHSAAHWGAINYIWYKETLFKKNLKLA